MLRPLYRYVLGLHPPGFRKQFGDEMLSIFDHSKGSTAALRLLLDGVLSLARQWVLRPQFWHGISTVPETQPALDGMPSFCSLDPFRPRAAAVVPGLILSVAVFSLTCFAIKYSWIHVLHVRIPEVQLERPQWIPPSASPGSIREELQHQLSSNQVPQSQVSQSPALQNQVSQNQVGSQSTSSAPPPPSRQSSKAPTKSRPAKVAAFKPGAPQPPAPDFESRTPAGTSPASTPQDATNPTVAVAGSLSVIAEDSKLDAALRHRVIDGAVTNLEKYYVYPESAKKMARALRAHESNGDDNDASDGKAFASLLTTQMQEVSHDQHVMLIYNSVGPPGRTLGSTPEELARYQREMERTNCTFEKAAVLPHNIGYLKLNSFPDPSLCQPTATAAMASLNQADALIFDLRENHGGSPSMVALMASYLFEHPTHLDDLYNRVENSTLQSWTLSPVPGNNLANKPVYVLTSASTFSGAEEFAYDLKLLKRATIVGETTAGAAHMVRRHRIDDHFSIGVPDTRPINPISNGDWEGKGVSPDVSVKAGDALTTAENLAEKMLQKN
ncbi:MAG TPA: S41 family peptidase [Candidatus Sulfotelmatobacter sp.]|nr:S41 family peptidase [Candidatus Sulfotelmatobacter sp.]